MANPSSAYSSLSLYDTTSLPYLGIQAPAGSVFRFGWAAPLLQQLDPSFPLDLYQLDFYAEPGMTQDKLNAAIGQFVPYLGDVGGQLVAYAVYEADGGPQQASDQICIPGTNYCVPNPIAARTYGATSVYRLVLIAAANDLLSQQFGIRYAAHVAPAYRAQIPFLVPIAIGIAILLVIVGVVYFIAYLRGQVRPPDVNETLKNLPIPGITPAAISAATLPLLALGVGVVAAAILIPRLTATVGTDLASVGVPVQAGVGIGYQGGGGGGGRRRRS